MTDRFVTVPDSLELPAAVKVPAARLSDSTAAGRALLTGADAAAQRTSLGLGNAAGLDMGTAAGTVMAGDDSRVASLSSTYATKGELAAAGSVTADDTPAAPAEGESASYFVTSAVVWPAGLVWSTDPDNGLPPTVTMLALVNLFTAGGTTFATLSATFPDVLAPAWTATLTTGTPGPNSVVIAASALATDAVGVTGYECSTDGGATWAAIVPSGLHFALTGLTSGTNYPAPQFRAADAAGNISTVLSAQAFATLPGTFLGTFSNLNNSPANGTYTFADVPIGDAAADRVVYVAVMWNGPVMDAGVTIGGVAATLDVCAVPSSVTRNVVAIAHAVVPTGETAQIDVDLLTGTSYRCIIGVWITTGHTVTVTDTALVQDVSASSMTGVVTCNAGDMVIAVSFPRTLDSTITGITWEGVTADYFVSPLESTVGSAGGGARQSAPAGDLTVTSTFVGGVSSFGSLAVATYTLT